MVVLLVEDEQKLSDVLKRGLEIERFTVDTAFDGEAGLKKALEHDYDVIVLDIMLPKKDGISVCRELRRANISTPIIMLSARGNIDDRVLGLDSGADDYITKPFGFDELVARIRSVLRRKKTTQQPTLHVGDITLNPATHEVHRDNTLLALTPKEYGLLEYFMRHPDRAISRRELLEHVWGTETEQNDNALNVHIRYLRRKVDPQGAKRQHIRTVRGVGYKIVA